MKRDMDLIRKILLDLEQSDIARYKQMELEGYDGSAIGYHCYLLAQAGLIEASDASSNSHLLPHFIPLYLTWDGHEFLNGVKDPSAWEKVKRTAAPAGGFVFSLAKEIIMDELKRRIGIA